MGRTEIINSERDFSGEKVLEELIWDRKSEHLESKAKVVKWNTIHKGALFKVWGGLVPASCYTITLYLQQNKTVTFLFPLLKVSSKFKVLFLWVKRDLYIDHGVKMFHLEIICTETKENEKSRVCVYILWF